MKDLVDDLFDLIIENEMPRVGKMMDYMANKIQGDIVGVAYVLIDNYYISYPEPKYYIRTDDLKNRKINSKKLYRLQRQRYGDVSLKTAIKSKNTDGKPLIGIAKGSLDTMYTAGIIFSAEGEDGNNGLNDVMQHSIRGIEEWDMVNNFLFSNSGDPKTTGNHKNMRRSPEADIILTQYIQNYDSRFDKHYQDAKKKFK